MSGLVVFGVVVLIKMLLFRTKPSTDFEVHRNWKAITNTLEVNKWYYEATSEWTLDYPPFFAYFEYALGYLSKFIDPEITSLTNLNYQSWKCLYYLRWTCLFGDVLLFVAIVHLANSMKITKPCYYYSLIITLQGFAGLIIIDNIHFQYNAYLFALMVFSISYIVRDEMIKGAISYCVLLNMKHLFIYLAPAYFAYYLKYYVFRDRKIRIFNFIKLVFSILMVFAVSFAPFLLEAYKSYKDVGLNYNVNFESLLQILKRLFPFKRGLLHTYWAPNFWALYSFIDKLCYKFLKDSMSLKESTNLSSKGITQEIQFDILPKIETHYILVIICVLSLVLVFYMTLIVRYKSRLEERGLDFLKGSLYSCFIFFNFGFHVHEKAFLTISLISSIYYIYLTVLHEDEIVKDITNSQVNLFRLTSVIGIVAQAPLILHFYDYLPKLFLVLTGVEISLRLPTQLTAKSKQGIDISKHFIRTVFLLVLLLDFIYVLQSNFNLEKLDSTQFKHGQSLEPLFSIFNKTLSYLNVFKFLPIMLISVISAAGTQISLLLTFFA